MRENDNRIRNGMSVYSTTGRRLGKVIAADERGFIVEKGLFFVHDHLLAYERIREVRGDDVVYRLADEKQIAAPTEGELAEPTGPSVEWHATKLDHDELRVPLFEEQVTIERSTHDAGSVRVHKRIVVEQKNVAVPLRREEVVVEHVPAAQAGEAKGEPFKEEHFAIPLHEEGYTLSTKPVVREEVRVKRVTRQDEARAATSVRHEEVDIEDDRGQSERDKERERSESESERKIT
jgi:uncharacterized protein (TIGR02271 family)